MSVVIKGGNKIQGTAQIHGSKNAMLPILASALLSTNKLHLTNVPNLQDTKMMLDILKQIGVDHKWDKKSHSLTLCRSKKLNVVLCEESKKIRASILILGPLLAAQGEKVGVYCPGGCKIGKRPIDIHIFGLEKLGAVFKTNGDIVEGKTQGGLSGTEIELPFPSVGATENLIMASCFAKGTTIIKNCAIEPEIIDLIDCLNKRGALIQVENRKITIKGVEELKEATHHIISDRIETGSYIIAAAITKGKLTLKNASLKYLNTEISILKKMGLLVIEKSDEIHVDGSNGLEFDSLDLKTEVYPGFSTDLQSLFLVLLCVGQTNSKIEEKIFENRFEIVPELIKMGANIDVKNNTCFIKGVSELKGSHIQGHDLRGTCALFLAGMIAQGTTTIHNFENLERGYEDFIPQMTKLGIPIQVNSIKI